MEKTNLMFTLNELNRATSPSSFEINKFSSSLKHLSLMLDAYRPLRDILASPSRMTRWLLLPSFLAFEHQQSSIVYCWTYLRQEDLTYYTTGHTGCCNFLIRECNYHSPSLWPYGQAVRGPNCCRVCQRSTI